MKKVFTILKGVALLIIAFIFANLTNWIFTGIENTRIEVNDLQHVIADNTQFWPRFTSEERKFLNESIENNNVLILFVNTEKEISKENISPFIHKFTYEKVPYTVFFYNHYSRTLSSMSSEDVNFNDITVNDVNYTEVYKYIPQITSNNYTIIAEQNIPLVIIFSSVLGMSLMFLLKEVLKLMKSLEWSYSVEGKFRYRKTFFDRGVKVKLNKNNNQVKGIWTNVVTKGSYFIIPFSCKSPEKKIIRVVNKDGTYCDYRYTYYDYGEFYNGSFDACGKDETKFEFEYFIKSRNK